MPWNSKASTIIYVDFESILIQEREDVKVNLLSCFLIWVIIEHAMVMQYLVCRDLIPSIYLEETVKENRKGEMTTMRIIAGGGMGWSRTYLMWVAREKHTWWM